MPVSRRRWSNRTPSSWLSALLWIAVVNTAQDQPSASCYLFKGVSSFTATTSKPLPRRLFATTILFASSNSNNNENNGKDPPASSSSAAKEEDLVVSDYSAAEQQDTAYNKFFRHFVQWLAELSLEDYQWRTNIFKSNEADRMLQQSLARMTGENATYVRPMDAAEQGPLGRWEQQSVDWLFRVMDEEGRRAQKIVANAGRLIRPSDNKDDEDQEHQLGPLGYLEQRVVEFFAQIRKAENERVRTKTLRPKDLEEAFRGPLGQLELDAVRTLEEIRASETLRAQQSRLRGGEIVRPIDVPGPLGELELKVAELFQAEQRRARERERNEGRIVRPKDAALQGPLGKAESTAYETIQSLSQEEMERLRNIRRALEERRPMDANRQSLLGAAEALMVGILRGPQMIIKVFQRVGELLQSQPLVLDENDKEIIKRRKDASQSEEKKTKSDDDGEEQ